MNNMEEKLMKYAKWLLVLALVVVALHFFFYQPLHSLISFMIQNNVLGFQNAFGCNTTDPCCPMSFNKSITVTKNTLSLSSKNKAISYSDADCANKSTNITYNDTRFRNVSASEQIFTGKPRDYVPYEEEGYSPIWVARGEVLVTFKENATMEEKIKVDSWLAQRGARLVGHIPGMGTYQYRLDDDKELALVLYCLKRMDVVWVASPNAKLTQLGESAKTNSTICYTLNSLLATLTFFFFILSAFFAIISRILVLMNTKRKNMQLNEAHEDIPLKLAKGSFIIFVVFLASCVFAQSAWLSFMIQNQIFGFDKLFGCEGFNCPPEFHRPYTSTYYGEEEIQLRVLFSSAAFLLSAAFLFITLILAAISLIITWMRKNHKRMD